MIYIAHRGNINGKYLDYENNPNYISNAIKNHFDVEVDLWSINNELFLGHDKPEHKINIDFLKSNKMFLWVHVKNFEAIKIVNNLNLHWFWHENDKFTLTSKKIIWTYIDVFIENAVVNQPTDKSDFWAKELYKTIKFHSICHDNIIKCKQTIED